MNLSELIKQASEQAAEHEEYIRNESFNERLDSGDIEGYELFLRKPDGEEQMLASMSAALFVTDLPTYRQLARDDAEQMRATTLNVEAFPGNQAAYDCLLAAIRHNATVIPFIGAGFSVAAGCPPWSDYIASQAERSGMSPDEAWARLGDGQHEQLMDEVIATLSLDVFRRDFRTAFEGGRITPNLSPATELVGLFDGSSITTNFDRVLERCHEAQYRPFDEKVVGNENTGRFLKAIYRGDKYLLKLHGNIDEQAHRVLTQQEYNASYGGQEFNQDSPIVRTLSKIFGNFSVLFLGCSLIADRYLGVLKQIYDAGHDYMPEHYAILVAPDDEDERRERDQFLASHGITPIWFEHGQWDAPGEILRLLKQEL